MNAAGQAHSGRRPPIPGAARRRGVVLIFVVAVLVLLVILSTAFYSTIRSQSLLQANRLTALQAKLAAISGVAQAARHLRALNNPAAVTDGHVLPGFPSDNTAGHFSRGDGWLQDGAGQWLRMPGLYELDPTTGARLEISPPNTFAQAQIDEIAPWPDYLPKPSGLDPATFRWSWANFWLDDKDRTLRPIDPDAPLIQPLVRNMTNTADIVVWPYFPGIALSHAQTAGELEALTASWSRGRRWVLTANQVLNRDRLTYPADTDFFGGDTAQPTYNPNFRHVLRQQQVQHPGYSLELSGTENPASPPITFSGYIDYRMAATDLDSRLYLPIGRWTPKLLAGTPNDRLDLGKAYGLVNRQTILKVLDDVIVAQLAGSVWAGNHLTPAVQNTLAVADGAASWGDLWHLAAEADPGMDVTALPAGDLTARNNYLFRKYLIPREYTCYPPRFQPDAAHGGDDLGRGVGIEDRPRLNINTAPREVLAANFAAVLLKEASVPADLGSVSPDELALRIIRCRPFFSYADWEDFLAANLEMTTFARILAAADVRTLESTMQTDSGGPRGRFDGSQLLSIADWDQVCREKRLLWFRDQIALASASRLSPAGFNALLNAGGQYGPKSYYAFTATVTYTEDTLNPGNPETETISWTEAGVPQSLSVPKAALWNAGTVDHLYEWNVTNDAALRPAWDTTGTYNYLAPTGGPIPDGWGALDRTQPVVVAMPIKLRSGIFEIFSRGRFIQITDQVPQVRATHKIHAIYDAVNSLYWLRQDLVSEKGALSDP